MPIATRTLNFWFPPHPVSFLGVSSVWWKMENAPASDQGVLHNGPWERLALTQRTMGGMFFPRLSHQYYKCVVPCFAKVLRIFLLA